MKFQVWLSTYDMSGLILQGVVVEITTDELDVQYTMATEVNQNCFAWPHEESSVPDSSQVMCLIVCVILDK